MTDELSPTEQALRELERCFTFFNERLFDGKLPLCLITLQRHRGAPGMFSPHRFIREDAATAHEIAINPQNFAMATLEEVLGVVARQCVHLWAHVQGVNGRRGYLNAAWASKMEDIGLMPTSTGKPGGKKTGERVAHYIIPGGKFDLAARELIDSGFSITWLDRIAAPWVETDGGFEVNIERKLLGGALLGKRGLLVSSGLADAGDPSGDLDPVVGGVSVGLPEIGDVNLAARASTTSTGERGNSFVDLLAAAVADNGEREGYESSERTAAVVLDTGSKARPGDKPVSIELISVGGTGQQNSPERPRQDKVRFKCPNCQMKAWAKGSAKLDCGKCKVPMLTKDGAAPADGVLSHRELEEAIS